MAHDVSFYDYESRKPICYFFGYAEGIMYRAFDATQCDAGLSGNGTGVVRNKKDILKGIDRIKRSGIPDSYLDPTRFDDVLKKIPKHLEENPDTKIVIIYS